MAHLLTDGPGRGDRVVLVDGTHLLERAFFAIPVKQTTPTGLHTNALFGLAQACRRVLAGKHPTQSLDGGDNLNPFYG